MPLHELKISTMQSQVQIRPMTYDETLNPKSCKEHQRVVLFDQIYDWILGVNVIRELKCSERRFWSADVSVTSIDCKQLLTYVGALNIQAHKRVSYVSYTVHTVLYSSSKE